MVRIGMQMENNVNIWKAFIEAQDILLQAYSAPFFLKQGSITSTNREFKGEVDTNKVYTDALTLIKAAFPGLSTENIDWENGVIKKPANVLISENGVSELIKEGPRSHLYAMRLPAVSFRITSTSSIEESFIALIGRVPKIETEVVYLSLDEISKIKEIRQDNILLLEPYGAIFKVQPSFLYVEKNLQQCKDLLSILHSDIKSNTPKGCITVYNERITPELILQIETSLPFVASDIEIAIKVENNEAIFNSLNDYWRKGLGIYWTDEEYPADFSIILPRPKNHIFYFNLPPQISNDLFTTNVKNLQILFTLIFGDENFSLQYRTRFHLQREQWWSELKHLFQEEIYQVNISKSTVSFDFVDRIAVKKFNDTISRSGIIEVTDLGQGHYYKVKFNYCNPLTEIEKAIKGAIPSINIIYSRMERHLICSYHYNPGEDNEHEKLIAQQRLNEQIKSFNFLNFSVEEPRIEFGYEEYPFEFKLKDAIKGIEQHLLKLKGEDICYKVGDRSITIGKMKKIDFPYIVLDAEEELEPDKLLQPLYGNLKGEQDKIKRLLSTVDKIYDDQKNSCVNFKIKEIIKDSKNAVGIPDLERRADYLEKQKEVEMFKLNKILNEKQLEAVTKSLFAEDLFCYTRSSRYWKINRNF